MDLIESLTGTPAEQVAETADRMGLTEFGWGLSAEQTERLRQSMTTSG